MVLLAVAILAAGLTAFRGAFVFDDLPAIVENPTIRDLGRPRLILFPAAHAGETVAGRPFLNLTFALNYAVSGAAPWSYHAVNLLIHTLAALALFGIVRRTLLRFPPRPARHGVDPSWFAFTVALLWALHPLQTAAVTYVAQRAESLMGLCFLLTLYCFIRGLDAPHPRRWQVATILACILGMGSKEVMVAAPLLVLLYDCTFFAGSWRGAWRARGKIHVALFSTWIILALLVAGTQSRGGTAGFSAGISPWHYALTQCEALVHYLRVAFWPVPLVFDYGTPVVRDLATVAPHAVLLLALLAVTAWALVRKPALGFLGAWFFVILAPSSSLVPVATQTIAEHRMYLPLAAVVTLITLGLATLAGRRGLAILVALALVAGVLTAQRNLVYHSELLLWGDTVAHRPENSRAHTNLGIALAEAGRLPEAIAQYDASLALQPDDAATQLNLCTALTRSGRAAEAVPHGEAAVRLEPDSAGAHFNLGQALQQAGRLEEAVGRYREALRLEPGAPDIVSGLAASLYDLGNQAAGRGDFRAAIARYREALAAMPAHPGAQINLANALLVSGQVGEAILGYREILRLDPDNTSVRENLARALELQQASGR